VITAREAPVEAAGARGDGVRARAHGRSLCHPRQNGFGKHLARSPEAVIRHWFIEVKRQSMVLLRPDLNRSIQNGKRGSWRWAMAGATSRIVTPARTI